MQISEWLGFVINTNTMTLQIPEKKVLKLKNLLSTAITEESSSYREFARIAGSIISLSLAVGPISRLLPEKCTSRSSLDQDGIKPFRFPAALLEELKF